MRKIRLYFNVFIFKLLLVVTVMILVVSCRSSGNDTLRQQFENPPAKYRPKPLWFINGELTIEGIRKQMTDAKAKAGFSGVALLPMASWSDKKSGTSPKFLSKDYFDRYFDVLNTAKDFNMEVVL